MTRLIADIGGTNARFALADRGEFGAVVVLPTAAFPTIDAAIVAYLERQRAEPRDAALAIAGPVRDGAVTLTNSGWAIAAAALEQRFGLERCLLLNDFTASAMALPYLAAADVGRVGRGTSAPGRPFGILGPGTGLGVSGLVATSGEWVALSGEGGHATIAPASVRESRLLDLLREELGHVSAERLLSGPGLVNIYRGLSVLDGVVPQELTPERLTDPAVAEADPLCAETVELFCGMLGGFAGNLALTLGAEGGIYVAGGIVPRLGPRFRNSSFRARFEAKGRFADYLARIPTGLVLHSNPALLGLTNLP